MSPQELIDRIATYIPQLVTALPVAFLVVLVTMLVNLTTGRVLLIMASRVHMTKVEIEPIRKLVRWFFRLLAVVLILGVFGFELGGLWAMISTVLGLVAIGFVAMWSILSNASSTILILFLRPFQIGDDIELAGEPVAGRVVDLNFFFTTLLDAEGRLLQVPNNLFFQKTLKRRRNTSQISLAQQLNSQTPANLPSPDRVTAPPATGPGSPDAKTQA